MFFLVMLLVPLISYGQITFQKIFGGTRSESSYKVEICSDGGYITAGYTVSSGPGDASMQLIKTDLYGKQIWEAVIGGKYTDYAFAVTTTTDGNYVAVGSTTSFGSGQQDIYAVKIDNNGNKLWEKTYGGLQKEEGWDIRQTNDGGFIITGMTNSFGATFFDAFLLKIDTNGNEEWKKLYGGPSYDSGLCVRQTLDGGYAFLGQTHSFGEGSGDFYLVKTDSNGNKEWSKTYGGTLTEEGRYFSLTDDGGFILIGKTESFGAGDEDIYVVKTDDKGILEWYKTFGGDKKDTGKSIEPTNDGGYIIASSSRSFNWANPNAWFIKIDKQGEQVWAKEYGGYDHDHGHHILPTSDGGYIATGHVNKNIAQMEDSYLLKLDSLGEWSDNTGIREESLANTIQIYPNPSSGIVELSLKMNTHGSLEINILSYMGKVIYKNIYHPENLSFSIKIDMQSFPKGIYLLRVSDGLDQTTTKVILD